MIYIAAGLNDAEKVKILETRIGLPVSYSWSSDYLAGKKVSGYEQAGLCMEGVQTAKVVGFLPPGGRGAHVEVGVALGLKIPSVMWWPPDLTDEVGFYRLFTSIVPTIENFITLIRRLHEST